MASQAFTLHRSWARQTTIGFLGAAKPTIWSAYVTAFEDKLRELNWTNGGNTAIIYRWAEGRPDYFDEFAEYFVDQEVDIIVTSGTGPALAAKKAAGKRIPVVFAAAGDPVGVKLIDTFASPGGNITGLSNGQTDLAAKRVNELHKMVPRLKRLAIVGNGGSRNVPLEIAEVQYRADELGIATVPCDIRDAKQIVPSIQALQGEVDALYVCTDLLLTTYEVALNVAAASARLPTMHAFREYVETGGLMSYGPDVPAMFARAAGLVDRILRGADPAEIAVEQPKTSELVISQSTADTLGLTIPKGVRKRAKVIQ